MDISKVTRLEVINYSNKFEPQGRAFVLKNEQLKLELELQDNDRTLKIYIADR